MAAKKKREMPDPPPDAPSGVRGFLKVKAQSIECGEFKAVVKKGELYPW